jgi:uncharacterized protein YdhG (YjbR/CyaY superfamily)
VQLCLALEVSKWPHSNFVRRTQSFLREEALPPTLSRARIMHNSQVRKSNNGGKQMAKTDFKTVDDYIQTFPKDVQAILEQIRQTIQKAVPEAEEVISYQLPAYKYHGWIFYFSAHKKHFSLSCPPPCAAFEAFKEELKNNKKSVSAVQFPLDAPVPVKLIHNMAQLQAKENLQKSKMDSAKTKTKAKKKS